MDRIFTPAFAATDSRAAIEDTFGAKLYGLYQVGSRVTCDPAPTDTDEDWLVLTYGLDGADMEASGFTQDGSPQFYTGNDNGGFRSWRRGDLNIITTESPEFFWKFVTATDLAKRFNLLAKADRIALFQAVLYGVRSENLQSASVEVLP